MLKIGCRLLANVASSPVCNRSVMFRLSVLEVSIRINKPSGHSNELNLLKHSLKFFQILQNTNHVNLLKV